MTEENKAQIIDFEDHVNAETERVIIGMVLSNNNNYHRAAVIIQADDFFYPTF
jgi:replicative DNA helicase